MQLTGFGKAVRRARIDSDRTLSQMANALGTTPAFLSAMETGRKKVPAQWVAKITEYFSQFEQVVLPDLDILAAVANQSVSMEGLSAPQQMFIAEFARRNFDDEQMEKFQELLGASKG